MYVGYIIRSSEATGKDSLDRHLLPANEKLTRSYFMNRDMFWLFFDWIGRITTIVFVIGLIYAGYIWAKGILPALYNLGNGLTKRKIAIFAKGENLKSINSLLRDSGLFNNKNIVEITTRGDLGRAEKTTLYLVFWHDWKDEIDEILASKKDTSALIVYAPQDLGFIPTEKIKELNNKRNVIVVNFRGRLLNDIVGSLITTSYQ